ncbi:sugar-binding protein [Paenibacillus nasutitermitis]|uniref:Carbohydrate-binding domain-containing protein n=1 Tax=Paenibacillus nasutitermitis TaxID=1652958 RepID=A0A917DWN5_9BACL|nr:sugar-binding protein [Paenibacillus nasutitermitis]GGD77505.1 hypothetical protein GCM10010911_39410 [Paenibacillus nasutitermitis]
MGLHGKWKGISIILLAVMLTIGVLPGSALASLDPLSADKDNKDNNDTKDKNGKSLVVFDMKAFLAAQPNSQIAYDYFKLATALQGLVNRKNADLYYLYESNYVAKAEGMDSDQFWLDELRKKKGFLASRTIKTPQAFTELLDYFVSSYNGVVVWDSNVPATANVASTAAGVKGWLPVRYDPAPESPYTELVVKRKLPVKLNLVGKFTGQGTIPDTRLSSSGSAKNDAYLWAKAKYLDTGLTHSTLMAYALDGVSWEFDQTKELSAKVSTLTIPKRMKAGEKMEVSITLRNNGTTAWSYGSNDRLGTTGDKANQFQWEDLNGGFSQNPADQRIFLNAGETVEPGAERTFTFKIVAPAAAGTYTFSAGMVRDGVAFFGGSIVRKIEVTTDGAVIPPPVPEAGSDADFVYPDLFNSFLPNADYYIANKAFFFDLSPDELSLPNDDRSQPMGTDHHTLIELLRSQNKQAGKNIITIGGFVPWWIKYTKHADSQARLEPVQAEWKYADEISRYNAQKDADAFGLVGLSNASLLQHVPLDKKFKQKNDKGKSTKGQYDPGKKYITFYMGDYDSGAWTSGALPALWNDPKRGVLPLAWAPVPGLSQRVPQVFNYLYDTMTSNDYFVAGDNGAGYLNPMMLLEENRPDGLPDFLKVWEKYNKEYYNRFDLDITGFLISGNSGYVPLKVQEAYSKFSPQGVGNNAGFEQPVVKGTPFAQVLDLPNEPDAAKYGEILADRLGKNQQFQMFRNVLFKPTTIVDAVNYVKEHYPDLDFEVVDPYTYFRFYEEAQPWNQEVKVYSSPKAGAIQADGINQPGEWEDAEEISISAGAEDVKKFGNVWGVPGNLQSTYRIKWDDHNLYLLEERQDDRFQFTETADTMYLSDASMFFLSLDGKKVGSAYQDGDYALMFTAGGPDGQPHMFMREGHNSGMTESPFTAGTIASVIDGNRYTVELSIPWSSLQTVPFAPGTDKSIGMSILATHGPDAWGQIMWVGNGDDQSKWADMKFRQ